MWKELVCLNPGRALRARVAGGATQAGMILLPFASSIPKDLKIFRADLVGLTKRGWLASHGHKPSLYLDVCKSKTFLRLEQSGWILDHILAGWCFVFCHLGDGRDFQAPIEASPGQHALSHAKLQRGLAGEEEDDTIEPWHKF